MLNIDALTVSTPYIVAFSLEDAAFVALQPSAKRWSTRTSSARLGKTAEAVRGACTRWLTRACCAHRSNDASIDFGFRPTIRIGDSVFRDGNGDGVQGGALDVPLVGVVLTLVASDGTVIGTTATDGDGLYYFDSLDFPAMQPNSLYRIEIAVDDAALGGLRASPLRAAGDAALDSDVQRDAARGVYVIDNVRTPTFGEIDDSFDAGFTPEITLGDKVWNDANGDGVVGDDEAGFGGVTVILRDAATGVELQRTVTDADGNYVFDTGLTSFTDYTISVPLSDLPPSFEPSKNPDSGVSYDPARNEAVLAVVTTGQYGSVDLTQDVPFVAQFNIGDRVFFDDNADFAQSDGERGVSGVEVLLIDGGGVVVARTATDANGVYNFNSFADNLLRVTPYTVSVALNQTLVGEPGRPQLDALYEPTRANQAGGDDLLDSDGELDAQRSASQVTILSPGKSSSSLRVARTHEFDQHSLC